MQFQVRLGSILCTQHLADILCWTTVPDALAKTITELEESVARLRLLQSMGLNVQRSPEAPNSLVVESPMMPTGMGHMLEVPPTRLKLAQVDNVLQLPSVREGQATLSGQELIELEAPQTGVAPISCALLADAFGRIERQDARVVFVLMNAVDYTDIRKFGRDILDIETQTELLKKGVQAHLWGAMILTGKRFPAGEVQFLGMLEKDGKEIWFRHRMQVTR